MCYGAGVMQGLVPPLWIVNASITSSASASRLNVCPPKVTLNTVLPMGRAWLSSSVSTVASWILIIPFSLVLFLFLMSVLYQIRFWLSTLQEPVGSRPSEHSTPSRGSDTLGASGAVADVVGEASDGHCCSFVCSHYTYIIGISQCLSLVIPELSQSILAVRFKIELNLTLNQ